MDFAPAAWFAHSLRAYPELAVFLALALGFAIGPRKLAGFTLGSVTATLLAGVLIGQLGITVRGPIKSASSCCSCSRSATASGHSSSAGSARKAQPDHLLADRAGAVPCRCPSCAPWSRAWTSGYAAGLYAGSQTISASIGVATDQIQRLGCTPEQAQARTPTRFRSATRSPTSSARSARPSCSRSSARS